jgi:hypothetical protein
VTARYPRTPIRVRGTRDRRTALLAEREPAPLDTQTTQRGPLPLARHSHRTCRDGTPRDADRQLWIRFGTEPRKRSPVNSWRMAPRRAAQGTGTEAIRPPARIRCEPCCASRRLARTSQRPAACGSPVVSIRSRRRRPLHIELVERAKPVRLGTRAQDAAPDTTSARMRCTSTERGELRVVGRVVRSRDRLAPGRPRQQDAGAAQRHVGLPGDRQFAPRATTGRDHP